MPPRRGSEKEISSAKEINSANEINSSKGISSAQEIAASAEAALRERVNPARRDHGVEYFKTALEILGVTVPDIRRVARSTAGALRTRPPRDVLAVAEALVDGGTLEGRQTAYELVALREDARAMLGKRRLDRLGRGNDNWGSVDALASTLAGPAWREGRLTDRAVEQWARSPNPWWRRTALASTVPLNLRSRGGDGDAARTLKICEILAHDRHPAVEKALSWALRSLIQHDHPGVAAFLRRHGEHLSARVVREVRSKLETGRKHG
jgi:3-methyladenine DNA glycosylase AlkD